MLSLRRTANLCRNVSVQKRQFSNLEELSSRIIAVKKTQKVCEAMKSIAASRLNDTELGALQTRNFSSLLEPFWKTDTNHDSEVKNVLLVPSKST